MDENKLVRVVWEDGDQTKTTKGYIVSEEEFLYKIKTVYDNIIIPIGKRAIVHILPAKDEVLRK